MRRSRNRLPLSFLNPGEGRAVGMNEIAPTHIEIAPTHVKETAMPVGARDPCAEVGAAPEADTANLTCARAPIGLLAELTHRCPLQCPYCSNPLELERANTELSTQEWQKVMRQAAALGILQIHLSGGEPTARRDLEEIVKAASEAGLYTNLITAAVLLTREPAPRDRLRRLPLPGLCADGRRRQHGPRLLAFTAAPAVGRIGRAGRATLLFRLSSTAASAGTRSRAARSLLHAKRASLNLHLACDSSTRGWKG